MSRFLLPTTLIASVLAWHAHADTFTASQLGYDNAILNQFNLVNLGNYTTQNETEGRMVIGGNATVNGTTNVCFNGCTGGNIATSVDATGQKYGALTVFGDLLGSYNVMNGGDIDVGGTTSDSKQNPNTFNLNSKGVFNVGGSSKYTTVQAPTAVRTAQSKFQGTIQNANGVAAQTGIAAAFPFTSFANTFSTPLAALAKGIAALPGSPNVHSEALPFGNNVFFTAHNDLTMNGKSYGVVTTTLADLAGEQNFGGINNNGNAATFVIVAGDGANYTLPNLNSYQTSSKVIFDFVDATTLRFGGAWSGSILAPLATITQQGGVLDGSVVAAAISQTNELHQDALFNGDLTGLAGLTFGVVAGASAVPEPASLALLAGAAALALVGHRRRRRR